MKLMRVMKTATKVIGLTVKQLEEIAESAVIDKINHIIEDPLHKHIIFNKSGRVRLPKVRTNRFRGSFLIRAMTLYNERFMEKLLIVKC